MLQRRFVLASCLCMLCTLTSCGGSGKSKPKTTLAKAGQVPVVPVLGLIHVDGAPASGVYCRFMATTGVPTKAPNRMILAISNTEGVVVPRLYPEEDGLPPGKYNVTFIWPTPAMGHRRQEQVERSDQFKGKYATDAGSGKSIVVEDGKPLDFGKIELKK